MAEKPRRNDHGAAGDSLEVCVICLSSRKCGHTRQHHCQGMASQLCGPWAVCVKCSERVCQKLTTGGKQASPAQFSCPVCMAELGPRDGSERPGWEPVSETPEHLRQAPVESAAQRAMRERNLPELRRLLGIVPLATSSREAPRSAPSSVGAPPTPGTQKARWAAVLSRRGGPVESTKRSIAMGYPAVSEPAAAPEPVVEPADAARLARREKPAPAPSRGLSLDDSTLNRCPDSLLQAYFDANSVEAPRVAADADARLQKEASERVRDEVASIRREEAVRRRSLSAAETQRDSEADRRLEAERQRHKQEQDRLLLEAEHQRQQEEVKHREWKEAKDREEKQLEAERRHLEEERQRLQAEKAEQLRREEERDRARLEECKERELVRLEVEHKQREAEIQRRVGEARLQIEVERRKRDEEQKRVEAERKRQREEQEKEEEMRLQKEAEDRRRKEVEDRQRMEEEQMRLQKETEDRQRKEAEALEAKRRKAEEDARLQMEAERRKREEERRLHIEAAGLQKEAEHRRKQVLEEQVRLREEADRRRRKEKEAQESARQVMEVERRRREQEEEERRHLEQKCWRLEDEKKQLLLEADRRKQEYDRKRLLESEAPRQAQKRQLDEQQQHQQRKGHQQQPLEMKRRQLEDEQLRVVEKRRLLDRQADEEKRRVAEKRKLLDAEEQVISEKRRRLEKEESVRKSSLAHEAPSVALTNAVRPVHTPSRASRAFAETVDDSSSKYPDHVVRAALTSHMKETADSQAAEAPCDRVTTQNDHTKASLHNQTSQQSDAARVVPDDTKHSPKAKDGALLARIQNRMRSVTKPSTAASQLTSRGGCAPSSSSDARILPHGGSSAAASRGNTGSALPGVTAKAAGHDGFQLSQLYESIDQTRRRDKEAGEGGRKPVAKGKVDEQKKSDDLVTRMRMLRQAYNLNSAAVL